MLLRAGSLAETHAVAAALAGLSRPGDVIVLAGEMGAGKTTFAQGFGRALGVAEPITSPTFTLVHSYPCADPRLTLHHADIYRLDRTGDVEDLALHELADFGGIVLIEWGDVASGSLGDHLQVRLQHVDPDDEPDPAGHGEAGAASYATDTDDPADDDFGLDAPRTVELEAVGRSWAGRWGRLTVELEPYRC